MSLSMILEAEQLGIHFDSKSYTEVDSLVAHLGIVHTKILVGCLPCSLSGTGVMVPEMCDFFLSDCGVVCLCSSQWSETRVMDGLVMAVGVDGYACS